MEIAATGQPEGALWVSETEISGTGSRRSRSHLLFQAKFNWDHWEHIREARVHYGHIQLPCATEPCSIVPAAFLLVMRTLVEVERLRGAQPRNVLQLLAAKSAITRVVPLNLDGSTADNKSFIEDDNGAQYTTDLSKQVVPSCSRHLTAAVWQSLKCLNMCPCLVDISVWGKTQNQNPPDIFHAGPTACTCSFAHQLAAATGEMHFERPVTASCGEALEAHNPPFFLRLITARDDGPGGTGPRPAAREKLKKYNVIRLKFQAEFRWSHYPKAQALANYISILSSTTACRSAPRAFMDILSILCEAELLSSDNPRNLLQLLAAEPRKTTVISLSDRSHEVPDRTLYKSDTAGVRYSTLLMSDDNNQQQLATAVFVNLMYLGLCPCLVDVIVNDTSVPKQSGNPRTISAPAHACTCYKRQRQPGKGASSVLVEPDVDSAEPLIEETVAALFGESSDRELGPALLEMLQGGSAGNRGEVPVESPPRLLRAVSSGSEGGSAPFDALLKATKADKDLPDSLEHLDAPWVGGKLNEELLEAAVPMEGRGHGPPKSVQELDGASLSMDQGGGQQVDALLKATELDEDLLNELRELPGGGGDLLVALQEAAGRIEEPSNQPLTLSTHLDSAAASGSKKRRSL